MGYYDEISAGYEELHRQEQEEKLQIIAPFLLSVITPETRLLDIGCGTGISLEPWDCEKVGIDPSEELLNIARKKGFTVHQAEAEQLPFKDREFDICLAITSIHHTNFPKAVKEIVRVCKSYFIFTILKKSPLAQENYKASLLPFFDIVEELDSDKDLIFVTKRHH